MDDIRVITAITLKEAASKAGVSFNMALLLAQSHRIISVLQDNKYFVSTSIRLDRAIEENQDFLNRELLIRTEGRSY